MSRLQNKSVESQPTGRGLFSSLFRIQLQHAFESSNPAGQDSRGFVFVAPLDDSGRIDAHLWRKHSDECRVVRYRLNEEDIGHLVYKPSGDWAFCYTDNGNKDDEASFQSPGKRFVIGEYISINEDDAMHTYKVASVEHV